MRKSFSSNSQLCHVWAQQTQSEGYTDNIFFEGNEIWSYGYHYKAAKIHTTKDGKRFALVNSRKYSNTTSNHLMDIRSALYGLMPIFRSPDVDSPSKALKHMDEQSNNAIKVALKRRKIQSREDISYEVEIVQKRFSEANKLRRLLKKPLKNIKEKDLNAVVEYLEKRLRRYNELNPPELIAKRKAEAEKLEQEKQKKALERLVEEIQDFRTGKTDAINGYLPYELLRVDGNRLKTSRGAEVPLRQAKKLYKAILAGINVVGEKVGHFTINDITDLRINNPATNEFKDEKLLTIGCHRLLFSEVQAVLAS